MRLFDQVMERAREKMEEVAEKTGEAVMDGWGKAKDLGEDLRKELLRLRRKTRARKKKK